MCFGIGAQVFFPLFLKENRLFELAEVVTCKSFHNNHMCRITSNQYIKYT